jgi:hypothetical protein
MKNIGNRFSLGMLGRSLIFFPLLLLTLGLLPMTRARGQGPPPIMELRGFVDTQGNPIDSVFAYSIRTHNLLAKSGLMPVDTVTANGDTVTVPNGYRLVVQGAMPQDTLHFRAKDDVEDWYSLRKSNGDTTEAYEAGAIKRLDLEVISTGVEHEGDENNFPKGLRLDQNYPNPFNFSTRISYTLERPGGVSLKVYDVLGRTVQTLVEEAEKKAGNYEVSFDASGLGSGVYFYRLNVNRGESEESSVKKMSLVK